MYIALIQPYSQIQAVGVLKSRSMYCPDQFPADSVEIKIADAQTAERLLSRQDPAFLRYIQQRRKHFEKTFGEGFDQLLDCAHRALLISYARFALRHGSWGQDLHAYHNEGHALEILADRLDYLCSQAGPQSLNPSDWVILTLFAATHDLRQRETPDPEQAAGANERASISECHRILDLGGFNYQQQPDIYDDLAMMIAGSTFSTQPRKDSLLSPAEAASSAGALAPSLVNKLNQDQPEWASDKELKRRVRLTLIASDLDTANVAEPILKYANSAVRLCREIEFRAGRDLGSESALPVLKFLTDGQETYFFELHEFDSKLGRQILGPMKDRNAPRVRELCQHLRDTYSLPLSNQIEGLLIIDEFMHKAQLISRAAIKS